MRLGEGRPESRGEKGTVAVVGGGIFGVMTALKLAEHGFSVSLFEKQNSVLLGASYINQNRLHMGYHYPRSRETAKAACLHQQEFQRLFPEAVVDDFDHYYCVARDNSRVSGEEFVEFCDELSLPYEQSWPTAITLDRQRIETCLWVPEKLYDANILRHLLRQRLAEEPVISVMLGTEILGVNQFHDGFEIHYHGAAGVERMTVDAVVNATYSNINRLITMLGGSAQNYQFELCEMAVVKAPWAPRVGCGVMDGPFFGILPFGKSGSYLLYDVETSVLERVVGVAPIFNRDVTYYDHEIIRADRFRRYIDKASAFIAEMRDCRHLYSIYVPRVVLANRDVDDARPTELLRHVGGVWSIFAGKVSLAIPTAASLAAEIELFVSQRSNAQPVEAGQPAAS